MIEAALAKIRLRDDLSAEEETAILGAIGEVVSLPARHTFVHRGVRLNYSTVLIDGMLARYKDMADGQRQITHVHVSGDFPDLHSFTLKYLDHSLMTLTPSRIAKVPHARLEEITKKMPRLTRILWFATNLDASIHREWEISLGRRTAIQRAAHLLCELQARLQVVGQADASGFALPITQAEFSECLGLTPVHVNRVLRDLREAGLCEFRGGRVSIGDLAGLRATAEFDPAYLYLGRRDEA